MKQETNLDLKPVIDKNIPNFSENPDYINNIVYHKEQ